MKMRGGVKVVARRQPCMGWLVKTHLGVEATWAPTAEKAMANVKYRYRGMGYHGPYLYWEVKPEEV
jgi:hypothetical protein